MIGMPSTGIRLAPLRLGVAGVTLAAALLAACGTTPGREEPLRVIREAVPSPDGTLIAVSTMHEEVALFSRTPLWFSAMLTREPDRRSQGRHPPIPFAWTSPLLAFAPDGKTLVAAGVAGHLVAWDVQSRTEKYRVKVGDGVLALVFLPNGQEFMTAGPKVMLWTASSGTHAGELPLPAGTQAMSVAVSPNGQIAVVGLSDGRIAIFDSVSRQLVRMLAGHSMPVYGVAFAPDGSMFASTAGQYDPRIWKADPKGEFTHGDRAAVGAATAAQASQEKLQALGGLAWLLGTIAGFHVVGAPTMGFPPVGSFAAARIAKAPYVLPDPKWCAPHVAFSPNGRYLASTGSFPGVGQGSLVELGIQLFITDLDNGQTRAQSLVDCSFGFTPDSRFVITGGLGAAPEFWAIETLMPVEHVPPK
jgi:WD40 repeat protein